MSAVRVLHISDRLSGRGGADLLLSALIGALAERGVEQRLLVGRREPGAEVRCPVQLLPGLDDTRAVRAPEGLAPLLKEAQLLTEAPQIVHVHNAIAPGVLAMVAAHGGVATVQDHRSFCPGQGKLTRAGAVCGEPMSRALCRDCFTDDHYAEQIHTLTETRLAALRRMARLIVLSRYMRRELVQAGAEPNRVCVVPPAVPHWPAPSPPNEPRPDQLRSIEPRPDQLHLDELRPNEPPCVLFCGRLVRAKGVLDAIAAYERAGVSLPLVFAGTGSLRAEIERRGYEVLGWRPHAEIGALYIRARALLMPSRWQEPYGMVGPEAQRHGVPVVAYRSGGIEEWHASPELLVPWGDVEALSHALRHTLTLSPPRYHGRDAHQEADETLAVYRAVLHEHPAMSPP